MKTGAHEVVTTIMMNGIAISLVAWAINFPLKFTEAPEGQNVDLLDQFPDQGLVGDIGQYFGVTPGAHLSWLLFLAIVAAIVVWFLIRRTRLGYEARRGGLLARLGEGGRRLDRRDAAPAVPDLGALAGLVGMQQILADRGHLPRTTWSSSASPGSRSRSSGRTTRSGSSSPRSCGGSSRVARWRCRSRARSAGVHHHPAGHPDLLRRDPRQLPDDASRPAVAARRRAWQLEDRPGRGRGAARPEERGTEAFEPAEKKGTVPFTDIAVALQISFTYFTIIYLTGLGGLYSERSGIVNIGLEGLMIIGTVTGAFGAASSRTRSGSRTVSRSVSCGDRSSGSCSARSAA